LSRLVLLARAVAPRRIARGLALAVACAAWTGCNVVQSKAHNLRQLHEDDGHHKRVAALVSDWEYTLRFNILGMLPGGVAREKTPVKIKNPIAECVENLLELEDFDPENLGVSELQVENFTRYATSDPWKISRQICVRALGRAGMRLELREHPAPPREGPVATEDVVVEALRKLIAALTPLERREGPAPSVEEACRAVAAMNLDIEGARRTLAAVALLSKSVGARSERAAPLRELSLELQRRCVRFVIEAALKDSAGIVRASAIEADVRVFGPERLAVHLDEVSGDRDVALAVLDLVARYGLPAPTPGADPAETVRLRDEQLARLYMNATRNPDDRVRVRSMQALARVSDAGIASLREEDWQTWWLAREKSRPTQDAVQEPPAADVPPSAEGRHP
jgi:hypothetical protein